MALMLMDEQKPQKGTKPWLYMLVVITSLVMVAFHADVMISVFSVEAWDRVDLPTPNHDWSLLLMPT